MNIARTLSHMSLAMAVALLANCANNGLKKKEEQTKGDEKPKFVNPYPAGTYENFKAEPSYPKTYNVWKNEEVLSRTNASNSHIRIDLGTQRGFLMNGDEVAMDYPICSGRKSLPTPRGTFHILEKLVNKRSNTYGSILDSSGDVINSNADSRKDRIPPGGKFLGSPMPYWMRLTNDGVGHHVGNVRRYPASHACIRGPRAVMPIVFSKVKVGSQVIVE